MAREGQSAGITIHAERRNVVAPLVAAIKQPTRGIEIKAPRIASSGPFLTGEAQLPPLPTENIPMVSCKRLPA